LDDGLEQDAPVLGPPVVPPVRGRSGAATPVLQRGPDTGSPQVHDIPTLQPPRSAASTALFEEPEPAVPVTAPFVDSAGFSGAAAGALPPSSPTEVPVPTAVPSPTTPVAEDQDSGAFLQGVAVPQPRGSRHAGAAAPPSSPTELPVPTAVPSPTSPVPTGPDDDESAPLPKVEPLAIARSKEPPSSPTFVPAHYEPTSPASPVAEKVEGPPTDTRTFEPTVPTELPPTFEPTVPTELPVELLIEAQRDEEDEGAPEELPTDAPPTLEPPPPTELPTEVPPSEERPPAPTPVEYPSPTPVDEASLRQRRIGGRPGLAVPVEYPSPLMAEEQITPVLSPGGAARPSAEDRSRPPGPVEYPSPELGGLARGVEERRRGPVEYPSPLMTEASAKAPTSASPAVERPRRQRAEGYPLPKRHRSQTPAESDELQSPALTEPSRPLEPEAPTYPGPSTPTEVTRTPPGTPTGLVRAGPGTPTRRGWGAPPTPTERQPGTPTISPTEEVFAPGTPADGALGRALRAAAGRTRSAEREGSSPTYITEDRIEEPLPPTPTYSGSSPTYVDENEEPPTPTLEPDSAGYGDDDDATSVVGSVMGSARSIFTGTATFPGAGVSTPLSAGGVPGTPQFTQPGTPMSSAAGTPQFVAPTTPLSVRLPGLESPTPTYEPDDEANYGDDGSSAAGFIGRAGVRTRATAVHPGTPGQQSARGTPPGTPVLGGTGTPQSAHSDPGTPHSGQPGTPRSMLPGTPLSGGTTTPRSMQPGTPQLVAALTSATGAAGRSAASQPGVDVSQLYDPFAVPAEASSSAVGAAPPPPPPPQQTGMPPLASELFPGRAEKRKQRGTASSDEELPPWKRRERRRKTQ